MRKFIPIAFILLFSCAVSAQEKTLTDYDLCKEDVSKSAIRKYEKALSFYKSKNYQKSSQILQQLIKEEEDFALPCFLMGMIGVVKDNTAMIMKYFPMVQQRCPQFDHPYQYYYMGMIDYTEERYEKAVQNFETFLSVTEGNNFYDSLQNVAINYIDWSEFLHNTIENKVDFNPKKINFLAENKNYAEPFITWDKQHIYFIREHIIRTSDKGGFISDVQTSSKRLLYVSELDSTGFYDKGFEAQDPFNNILPQSGVSMTADNNFVFFAAKNNADKSDNTWNIYRCERVGDYFSQATPVNINTTLFNEMSPCVSADGNLLFFSSDRQGGKGGYDIWMSKRTDKDKWSDPVNLGRNVNTFGDETSPFIAADNTHLYFLSNGRKTIGGKDIFCYNLQKDSPAENIGYPVNTENDEQSVGVALDGRTAYSVFRLGEEKYGTIYTFELNKNVQADKRVLVKLNVNRLLQGNITFKLTSLADGETFYGFVSQDYNNTVLVLKPQTDYVLTFDQKGYLFAARKISSLADSTQLDAIPLETGAKGVLHDIVFNAKENRFDNVSVQILDAFTDFLKLNQRIRTEISAPQTLGKAIETYLIKSGIRQDRISLRNTQDKNIVYTVK